MVTINKALKTERGKLKKGGNLHRKGLIQEELL